MISLTNASIRSRISVSKPLIQGYKAGSINKSYVKSIPLRSSSKCRAFANENFNRLFSGTLAGLFAAQILLGVETPPYEPSQFRELVSLERVIPEKSVSRSSVDFESLGAPSLTVGKIIEKNKYDVGILLASHGDIDSISEAEDYIKTAYKKNDAIPLPSSIRELTAEAAYLLSKGPVLAQYHEIGHTHYRENTKKQVDALTKALEDKHVSAKAYAGFNFTNPFISNALEKMQLDGVKKIVLINQGAQFSTATGGENIEDVKDYLANHPEWKVEVVSVNQFSSDLRFRDLLAKSLIDDIKKLFPNDRPEDVSILLGSHGLPMRLIENGDPAVKQMNELVEGLKERLPDFKIYHGYLNDDFFPGAEWIGPNISKVAKKMNEEGNYKVLMDGRVSFTVHHRATLYDMDKVSRSLLSYGQNKKNNAADENNIKLAPNFDGNTAFAQFLSNICEEALAGIGDISVINKT